MTASPERLAKAAEAARLRGLGKTYREIGEALGVSNSMVADLLCDPDRSRTLARRETYRTPCPDCGVLTGGSEGRKPGQRCSACAAKAREITPEQILAAFTRFYQVTGRAPTTVDAMHAAGQRDRLTAERLAEVDDPDAPWLPYPSTVSHRFGSWQAAVRAAGITPAPWGYSARRTPYPRRYPAPPGGFRGDILARLAEGPARSDELTSMPSATLCGVSTAIREDITAGRVVRSKREGKHYWYRLAEPGAAGV